MNTAFTEIHIDIHQLKYCIGIVEKGQLSRAARRLNMAQPPLSLQLKMLEDELGARLIERNTKSLRLTEAGHALYPRAEQIVRLVDTTAKEIREFGQGLRGTPAISSPPGIGHLYMPPRIAEFYASYSEVNFQWREGNTYRILELLDARVIAIGIVRLPIDDNSYEQIPLLSEPWVAVTRKVRGQRQPKTVALPKLARRLLGNSCRCSDRKALPCAFRTQT